MKKEILYNLNLIKNLCLLEKESTENPGTLKVMEMIEEEAVEAIKIFEEEEKADEGNKVV